MSTIQTRVHIRWLIRRDAAEVMAIEQAAFDFPRSEEEILAILRNRNAVGMIAEVGERVVGFFIYLIHKDHFELLDFATDSRWRHRGIGSQMAQWLIAKTTTRRPRIVLRVRETSLEAQCFWRQAGFLAVGVEREAFGDTGESAYQFEWKAEEF